MLPLIRSLLDKKGERRYKVIFILYTFFLFTITLMPLNAFGSGQGQWLFLFQFENFDKVVHTVLFFIFTGISYLALNLNKILLFVIPVLTGLLIEILQHTLNIGRTFDPYDVLSNALGTICMLVLVVLLEKDNR